MTQAAIITYHSAYNSDQFFRLMQRSRPFTGWAVREIMSTYRRDEQNNSTIDRYGI